MPPEQQLTPAQDIDRRKRMLRISKNDLKNAQLQCDVYRSRVEQGDLDPRTHRDYAFQIRMLEEEVRCLDHKITRDEETLERLEKVYTNNNRRGIHHVSMKQQQAPRKKLKDWEHKQTGAMERFLSQKKGSN